MANELELLKAERDRRQAEKAGQAPSMAAEPNNELEMLKAERAKRQSAQVPQESTPIPKVEHKKPTGVGEDIVNVGKGLWEGAKKLPGAVMDVGKGIVEHPGQAAAGLVPGITSIADIPAMLINAGLWIPEYAAKKITGDESIDVGSVPYYGHQIGTKVANKFAGKPKTPEEESARLGGELSGAFVNPSQLVKKAATGAAKLPGKAAGFAPDKFETFAKADIIPTLPEVSNFKSLEAVQKGLEHIPFSAGKIEKVEAARQAKIDKMFKDLGNINQAKPVRQTGEITKRGGKEYNAKAQEVTGKLYEKAWKGLDKTAPVPMPKTYQTIQESLKAISPEARARIAESATGKELLRLEESIINSHGAIPFDDIRRVYKKDIDKGVKMWQGVSDVDQGVLKQISGALKQDMDDFVRTNNPQAAKDLDRANKHYSLFSERNKDIANAAIKQKDPIKTFEGMVSDLKGGDIAPPKVLLQRMKAPDKKAFSEIFLGELGRGADGGFDAMKMAKEVNKMRPESLEVALSGMTKPQANQVKDMSKAIALMKPGQAQTSGMSYLLSGLGAAFSPTAAGYGIPAARALTEVFTNPKVTEMMYKASKLKTPLQLEKFLAKQTILPKMEVIREQNEKKKNIPKIDPKEAKRLIKESNSPALKGIMKQKSDPNEFDALYE